RDYLEAALAGHRAVNPQRLARHDDPPPRRPGENGNARVAAADFEGLSFFVKRRTDLLEVLGDHEALAWRPPRTRVRKRLPALHEADRLTWLARWGYYHHAHGEADEARRRFAQAREL